MLRAMKYALAVVAAFLAACSSVPPREETAPAKGGYYKDDGPGDKPPANLAEIADAEPKAEPMHRYANRPYTVFGNRYVPLAEVQPFRQRGLASWYGRRFHGQRTSSGEVYDMYAMTAAHPTLPIPSYVRVTSVANGRSVVVRVNDRGPFHGARIIDLSYAAAHRLGFVQAGSTQVELESIVPGEKAAAVYVQVGSFRARENAESLHERVRRELAWLQEAGHVFLSAKLWRLQLGPYASQDAARKIAERIEAELALKPLVVVR
jgi:rare lipoprotein A